MKRKFLDIDKSKFDFLLERMDKKYTYEDLQVIVEEKKLLKEAPGGVKSFTNALRVLSNIDNADMLLKAGIRSQDDLVELMNAATALRSIGGDGTTPLKTFEFLDLATITRALNALGDNIPNVTKFTNEIIESVEVAKAVNKAIKEIYSGGETNAILELMISKGDTFRSVDDLIKQVKSVDQKFPGFIDKGLPSGKRLKEFGGDVELVVLKNSIAPDGMPVRSLPMEVQGLIRKKISDYGVKEVEVPETINAGLQDPLPDGTGIVYTKDGSVAGIMDGVPKGSNFEFTLNGKKFHVKDILNPLKAHKVWWNTIQHMRMPKTIKYKGSPVPIPWQIRWMVNGVYYPLALAALPIPQVAMAGILECAFRIIMGHEEELIKGYGDDAEVTKQKLDVSDCITGLGFGDKFRNPMWFPLILSSLAGVVARLLVKTGILPGMFDNQGEVLLTKLENQVAEVMHKLYDQIDIHALLNSECTKEKMSEYINKQNKIGADFIKQFKPKTEGFDIWQFIGAVVDRDNPLVQVDDADAVYDYFGVVNDSKVKYEKSWKSMQAYLPEHLKGDVNKFNTEAYILYKCEVLRLRAIALWLQENEKHLKDTQGDKAWYDCEMVKFWKKLSTENGKVEEKSSKEILKNNKEQFMKIKDMIQKDPQVKLPVKDTVFDPKLWDNVLTNWAFIEAFEADPTRFKDCKGVEYMLDEDEVDVQVVIEPGPTIVLKPEYVPPNYSWEYLTKVNDFMACSKIKLGISMADYEYVTIHQKNYDMPAEERTWNDGVPSYPTIGPAGINLLSDPQYSNYCKDIEGGKTVAQCKASLTAFINTLSC